MKCYAFGVMLWAASSTSGSATCAAKTSAEAAFATGVAPTPKNFPNHRPEDVEEMFGEARELGKFAIFIYQWSQPDLVEVAKQMMERSRESGLTPVLAISPLVLSGARSEYDAPESVRKETKGALSFENDKVHMPYIRTVLELAKLKPPHLCLATEINFLAFKEIKEYLTFGHVYKKLYPEIKKISPGTKVFVSFQWDFFQVMARDEPGRIKEHGKLIEVFRPELDLVAFTSYPADRVSSVNDIPAAYYSDLRQHLGKSEEVMFMEIGWPTNGKGTNESQRAFIERLPELMKGVRPELVAWSLLHDVKLDILGDLASTGLVTADGIKKPGYEAFQELARE